MGYWTFLGRGDAASLIEANVSFPAKSCVCTSLPAYPFFAGEKQIDSFLDVFYPADPETCRRYMNLPGELELFVKQQKRLSRASYVTPEVSVRLMKLGMSAQAP